tara:strand:+ start:135 stop:1295 length:1161 start_codon:yes stop_codon:yes gene_type:complete
MKICIITSTRADFGLLKNLIFKIKKNKKFKLKVIASGTHFSKKYGYTYNEIKDTKIKVDEKIICKFNSDNSQDISKVMSKCILDTSKLLKKLKPNLLIVLGDRYEILASTISSSLCRIPVAHIHGGEVTNGAIDDAFRHSITKMSHIHFVANIIYKERVIQLGENPKNVHIVGGLGVDSIAETNLISKAQLEKKLKINLNKKSFLINFHPETANKNTAQKHIKELLSALKTLKTVNLIFTMPGADLENRIIVDSIKKFCKNKKNTYFFKSLGQIKYFSLLKYIDAMIGNSSSGILEMPFFKKGTINIGDRQSGRVLSNSIINVKMRKNSIILAINKLFSKNFKRKIVNNNFLYGRPGASKKIVKILEKINLNNIRKKRFFDLNLKY